MGLEEQEAYYQRAKKEQNDDRDTRSSRTSDTRFPRESDRGGGGRAGERSMGTGRGALGRVHRFVRGRGAPRRRRGLRRQGRAHGGGTRQRGDLRCSGGRRCHRPARGRPPADRGRRHAGQGLLRGQRHPGNVAGRGQGRRRRARPAPLPLSGRGQRPRDPRAHDEHPQRRQATPTTTSTCRSSCACRWAPPPTRTACG